jgi:predicted metal-dependent peptidase
VARFLADLRFGRAPADVVSPAVPARTEDELFARFVERGIPAELSRSGTAGDHASDMVPSTAKALSAARQRRWGTWGQQRDESWEELFTRGLQEAVRGAVTVAAGRQQSLLGEPTDRSRAALAREWFIHSYPLLGGVAAAFKLIEDPEVCRRLDISVAAIDAGAGEIYINPHAGLDDQEMRFVMAHELLHAGLRHHARAQGREPYLWNVACDYVINAWLVEMGVGQLPRLGGLLDPELKGLSAEQIYDRIARDLRTYRKLATLRGTGLGDMLGSPAGWWERGDGVRLDELYRNALTQGLHYHREGGRGLLPVGLEEEIRGLNMPPIPWEVDLARWFDEHFAPVEAHRTYARMSRRQAATPHIPRPAWVLEPEEVGHRTFGVVLDTSWSMDKQNLAKALGTIASYAIARDVPAVRLVFCDAAPYDAGYMAPEEMLGRVRVRGRGGTVLQPGVDLLEEAKDFPPDGPILLITDGWCDRVQVRREHAYVLPYGATLPFVPKGKVFRVR